jgi:predicted TIM-barrel fold metal-dependent hydrolase
VTTGVVSNEKCEDFCKDHKELIPFCTVNPHYNPDMVDIVKEFCGNRGFKGVKLYPPYNHFYPNDPVVYPVYAAAQALGVPVQFHTGSSVYKHSRIKYGNPIYMDDVAVDFPDLVLVLAHGGRGAWYDEAMTMARIHKNVYIDLAGLPPRNFKRYFPEIERFADKFLFGTDWTQMAVKEHLDRYLNLGYPEEATQKIIGRNAAKILKIETKS